MNAERSFALAGTYSDEHIERWAAEFLRPDVNRQLRARGISFECFLTAPEEILAKLAEPLVITTTPGLLARQRAIQASVDADRALEEFTERALAHLGRNARCANGAWIEPLHHCTFPRKTWRKFHKEA